MAASVDTSLTRAASVDSIESSIHCDAEDAAQKTVHFTPEPAERGSKEIYIYYYELKIQSTGKAHLTAIEQISQEINCPIQKIKVTLRETMDIIGIHVCKFINLLCIPNYQF